VQKGMAHLRQGRRVPAVEDSGREFGEGAARSSWWGETGQRCPEDDKHSSTAQAGTTGVLQDDDWRSGRIGSSMTMIAVAAGGFFFKWHRETTCGLCWLGAAIAGCMFCRETVRRARIKRIQAQLSL